MNESIINLVSDLKHSQVDIGKKMKTEKTQSMDSKRHLGSEINPEHKGVIPRLLGVVMILLGFMNSMLSWRGGFAIDPVYIVMLVAGLMLYITGILARNR